MRAKVGCKPTLATGRLPAPLPGKDKVFSQRYKVRNAEGTCTWRSTQSRHAPITSW